MRCTRRNPRSLLLHALICAAFASAPGWLPAQQTQAPVVRSAPQPAPQPTLSNVQPEPAPMFTAVARAVLLDVVVTDAHGHPVKDLKPSDFTLLEDGAPQKLDSFQEHTAMTAAEVAKLNPPAKLPPNTFTNFTPAVNTNASTVILLDALDTPVAAQMYLRQQVIAYMRTVPPGTSIAIFQLNTGMRLVQGFSSDPQVLLDAVKSSTRDSPEISPLLAGHNYPVRSMRQDILKNGMQMLGRYLAGFPGRKNLIWFTGVVPRTLYDDGIGNPFRDSSTFIDEFAQSTDVLTLSRVAVYPIDSRGLQTDPAFSAAHAGRPRTGLGFDIRQQFQHGDLDDIADATGGKAFYNSNGLRQIIAGIVDAGSNYYTLAYTPTNKNWNGEYRQIRLQVAGGFALQYRHGYYAHDREQRDQRHLAALQRRISMAEYSPDAVTPGAAPPSISQQSLDASMALGAVPPTELIFDASVTASPIVQKFDRNKPLPPDIYLRPEFQKKPYRNYKVLYALNARTVHLSKTPDGLHHGQVDFVAVVYTDRGDVVNSLIATSTLNLRESTYQSIVRGGIELQQTIAVPVKGNYFLRLGVDDVDGDRIGAIEIPLEEVKTGVAGAGQTLTP